MRGKRIREPEIGESVIIIEGACETDTFFFITIDADNVGKHFSESCGLDFDFSFLACSLYP